MENERAGDRMMEDGVTENGRGENGMRDPVRDLLRSRNQVSLKACRLYTGSEH